MAEALGYINSDNKESVLGSIHPNNCAREAIGWYALEALRTSPQFKINGPDLGIGNPQVQINDLVQNPALTIKLILEHWKNYRALRSDRQKAGVIMDVILADGLGRTVSTLVTHGHMVYSAMLDIYAEYAPSDGSDKRVTPLLSSTPDADFTPGYRWVMDMYHSQGLTFTGRKIGFTHPPLTCTDGTHLPKQTFIVGGQPVNYPTFIFSFSDGKHWPEAENAPPPLPEKEDVSRRETVDAYS